MHGRPYLIRALQYGSDGAHLYLRVDFEDDASPNLAGASVRVRVEPEEGEHPASTVTIALSGRSSTIAEARFGVPEHAGHAAETAFESVLEVRLSLAALGVAQGRSLRFQLSMWRDGLPMDALPQEGLIEVSTAEPSDWPVMAQADWSPGAQICSRTRRFRFAVGGAAGQVFVRGAVGYWRRCPGAAAARLAARCRRTRLASATR
jgi:hypothetical protein